MPLPKPSTCVGCPLYGNGQGFSHPEGSGSNGVLVVGEALGAHEEQDGLPFRPHAEAGSCLERAFKRGGHPRPQFVLYNLCQCRPPNNELEGQPWEREAVEWCRPNLDAVIERFKPRVIMALGNLPLKYLTNFTGDAKAKQSISFVRGFVVPSRYGIPLVASFHPSFLRHGQMKLLGVLIRDIQEAVGWAVRPAADLQARQAEVNSAHLILDPSADEAQAWAAEALGQPDLPVAYDIETGEIAGADEQDLEWISTAITQVQFSVAPNQAMVMPWIEPFKEAASGLLRGPNPKWGFNTWGFDEPVLEAHDVEVGGESIDLMWAWHHLQPDLPRNLQFVTSFYAPLLSPWKHLATKDLAFYGAGDVVSLQHIGRRIFDDLRRAGLWEGFERHVLRLWPILHATSRRGLPYNQEAQQQLRGEMVAEKNRLLLEMQTLIPPEERPCIPSEGYKSLTTAWRHGAPALLEFGEDEVEPQRTPRVLRLGEEWAERDFDGARRWCRVQPFVPSNSQLTRYMRARGHKVPTIPGEDKQTTGKLGVQRLAARTKDPLYRTVLEYREVEKAESTYLSWPSHNGRVHTTFTFAPATGQLSSRDPNIQNVPRKVTHAKAVRRLVRAEPGHKLVSCDYKSFHALTLGYEARDLDYMRLARLDIHSYAAAHFLKMPERDRLLVMPDDELRSYFGWFRSDPARESTRNDKAKNAILGYGFGLGARKLYETYIEAFASEREARQLIDLLNGLFPRAAAWKNEVRQLAHARGKLVSAHGFGRYFWDVMTWDARRRRWTSGADSEKAVAFLPANDAFGIKKEAMLALEEMGRLERWELVNEIHDELLFHPADELVEECATMAKEVMERPSKALVDPVAAPGGLWCEVGVKVGEDWGEMREWGKEGETD